MSFVIKSPALFIITLTFTPSCFSSWHTHRSPICCHLQLCCCLLYVSFLCLSLVRRSLLICRLTATFTWFSASLVKQLLSLEEVIWQSQQTLQEPLSFRDHLPWHSSKQTPQQWLFSFPRIRVVIPLFALVSLCSILHSTISWSLQESCTWHSHPWLVLPCL